MKIERPLVTDIRNVRTCWACKKLTCVPDFNFIALLAWRLRRDGLQELGVCDKCRPVGMT